MARAGRSQLRFRTLTVILKFRISGQDSFTGQPRRNGGPFHDSNNSQWTVDHPAVRNRCQRTYQSLQIFQYSSFSLSFSVCCLSTNGPHPLPLLPITDDHPCPKRNFNLTVFNNKRSNILVQKVLQKCNLVFTKVGLYHT